MPQNTLDAKTVSPARLKFVQRRVPVSSIPDLEGLRTAIARCAKAASADDSEKAGKFFASAQAMLAEDSISILQITDSNTTCLVGPCENGKPYFALMKATGQSRKIGTSTGSYGIGKFAPFAVSELRTVFVSTVWRDGTRKAQHYVQGKSILMSHLDSKKRIRRGTGFWGHRENCSPVIGLVSILPDWLRLADRAGNTSSRTGTMLTIVGFKASRDWQKMVAANIVENFFGAIDDGSLEIDIQGGLRITQGTLANVFTDPAIQVAVDEPDRLKDTSRYLQVLAGGQEVIVEKHENFHLGECRLRILVGENLPRRDAVLRNGMLITESLPGLKRFSDYK